jgi:hypothetical protein
MTLEVFIPAMAICTVFFFIWVVLYPTILKDILLFRYTNSLYDVLHTIGTWIFAIATAGFFVWLVKIIK